MSEETGRIVSKLFLKDFSKEKSPHNRISHCEYNLFLSFGTLPLLLQIWWLIIVEIREEKLKKLVKRIQEVPVNTYAFYTNTLNLKPQKRSDIILTNCSKFLESNWDSYNKRFTKEDWVEQKLRGSKSSNLSFLFPLSIDFDLYGSFFHFLLTCLNSY